MPCPQYQLLLWDRADFVTARGALAHALGRAEPGRHSRTLAVPPAAAAVPWDRGFSIYYSIYCSRCCLPGVGGPAEEEREHPVQHRAVLGLLG